MLFDLTFPCYLTTFSGKTCLSGKVVCAFFLSRLSKFSCILLFTIQLSWVYPIDDSRLLASLLINVVTCSCIFAPLCNHYGKPAWSVSILNAGHAVGKFQRTWQTTGERSSAPAPRPRLPAPGEGALPPSPLMAVLTSAAAAPTAVVEEDDYDAE
jgi:hypothetical protein